MIIEYWLWKPFGCKFLIDHNTDVNRLDCWESSQIYVFKILEIQCRHFNSTHSIKHHPGNIFTGRLETFGLDSHVVLQLITGCTLGAGFDLTVINLHLLGTLLKKQDIN